MEEWKGGVTAAGEWTTANASGRTSRRSTTLRILARERRARRANPGIHATGRNRHATSLGGVESTIERRAAIPGQPQLPPGLLRLGVGCEHPAELCLDLQQAFTS
jgi:cystathionine beta-lyase/cystathionine gamma-synthase